MNKTSSKVITSVQRRRRWSSEEKMDLIQETYRTGSSVSSVARQHGISPSQLFNWRRCMENGAVVAVPSYSPESNGMAEALVKTMKRDYAWFGDLKDAETVMGQLAGWFEDYNENAPHKGLKMMSPREFIRLTHAS